MVTGATSLSLVRDELFATMEQAEQNLQWLRSRTTGGAATSGGGAASPSPATDTARTWNSLQGG